MEFETTMTTHKLVKKRGYRQSCLFSDWIGFQPFSENIICINMVVVIYLTERQIQRARERERERERERVKIKAHSPHVNKTST